MAEHKVTATAIQRRQSLSASISKACPKCNAPGVFQNSESFIEKYPNVFRPTWAGRDVGPICPCCNSTRDEKKELGEIWSKTWKPPGILSQVVEKVKGLIKR